VSLAVCGLTFRADDELGEKTFAVCGGVCKQRPSVSGTSVEKALKVACSVFHRLAVAVLDNLTSS